MMSPPPAADRRTRGDGAAPRGVLPPSCPTHFGFPATGCPMCALEAKRDGTAPAAKKRHVGSPESRAKNQRLAVVRTAAERARERAQEKTMPAPVKTLVEFDGRSQSAIAWAKEKGVPEGTIRRRWLRGVRGDALFAPADGTRDVPSQPASRGSGPKAKRTPRAARVPRERPMREAVAEIALSSGPAALLRAVGYEVTEVATPRGVALLVAD